MASEMAQWGKALAVQTRPPEFDPKIPHWKNRTNPQKLSSALSMCSVACMYLYSYMQTHTHRK